MGKFPKPRTDPFTVIYWLGVAAPVLMVAVLKFIEHSGAKQSIGVGGIALVSLTLCAVGACLSKATTKKKFLLVLVAAIVIPVELLVIAVLFLVSGGLSGTQ